jgi:hypothetical protein
MTASTITVETDENECTLAAASWNVTEDGYLRVVAETGIAAQYAPGRWISVVRDSARASHDSPALELAIDGLDRIARGAVEPQDDRAMEFAGELLHHVRALAKEEG